MVTQRQEELGWQFIFMGVDMDAFAAGASIGIRPERTRRKERTARVMVEMCEDMDMMISEMRSQTGK